MVTIPLPNELLFVLALLPGYVMFRVGLFFARETGPINWPRYEKIVGSLVGSVALLAIAGLVFPAVVGVIVEDEGLFVTTDLGLFGYLTSVLLAVVLGVIGGKAWVALYERLYGVTIRRVGPRKYLLRRLEDPGPARVVTDDRELVGRVKFTDGEGTPAVLREPRLVTTRDGAEYQQRMGSYAYVDPETVESVYYESSFKPERGGLVARAWRRLRPPPEESDERAAPEPEPRAGPSVTVSKDPLLRETDRVRARGTVRNERDVEVRSLQVTVEFEDADGHIVGAGVDRLERLGAGDAWWFDVAYATDDPDSVESATVKW